MAEKESVHEILSKALDADESGDKEQAVDLYTQAVELILKISDPALKERLNKYALQALERAEELRGISSPTHKAKNVENPASNQQPHSKFKNACIRMWFNTIAKSFTNEIKRKI